MLVSILFPDSSGRFQTIKERRVVEITKTTRLSLTQKTYQNHI